MVTGKKRQGRPCQSKPAIKRLLKRCGGGEGYLIETITASFRPPGLRIRRAEALTIDPRVRMSGRSPKTGNVLSTIESQGFRIQRAPATSKLKLMPAPPGNVYQRLKDASSPKSASKRTKGQPEGSAVTGKTRKPRVAENDLGQSMQPARITVI